jgi:hypothetical protein
MRWVGHAIGMRKIEKAYSISEGKTNGNALLWRLMCRWEKICA